MDLQIDILNFYRQISEAYAEFGGDKAILKIYLEKVGVPLPNLITSIGRPISTVA